MQSSPRSRRSPLPVRKVVRRLQREHGAGGKCPVSLLRSQYVFLERALAAHEKQEQELLSLGAPSWVSALVAMLSYSEAWHKICSNPLSLVFAVMEEEKSSIVVYLR